MIAFQFVPASRFTLETLAALYTRTFEGYVMKAIITPAQLETFIRVEDLDLDLSPVLCVGAEMVGFATVGMRGSEAYCRGFGVTVPYRGKGLAHALCEEMIRQARNAGARTMTLGVLIENQGAVKTYLRAGFRPARELHSVAWRRAVTRLVSGDKEEATSFENVCEIEPRRALEHFAAFHPGRAVWNRALPSLKKMNDLQGRAIVKNDTVCAYVLFRTGESEMEILDLGAARARDGVTLLCALQQDYPQIVCYNEPAESPMHAAFRASDFVVTYRRYEMCWRSK